MGDYMVNFAQNDEEAQYFITDIDVVDDKIIVKYADQREVVEKYDLHTLNYYRLRMTNEIRQTIPAAISEIASSSFNAYLKRLGVIIGGIISGLLVYNIDINIIMKFVITGLILLGQAAYFICNEINLRFLSDNLGIIETYQYYLNNLHHFKYYNAEIGEDCYLLPIEDVGKYNLSEETLKQIVNSIIEYNEQGTPKEEIKLKYRPDSFSNM